MEFNTDVMTSSNGAQPRDKTRETFPPQTRKIDAFWKAKREGLAPGAR